MTLTDCDELLIPAAQAVGMPDAVFRELLTEWVSFRKDHVGEHPEDISFEYELFPAKPGLILIVVEPEGDHVNLTVKAEDPETGDVVELDPVPPEAWVAILPVEERKAEKRVPVNAKCPCGSGKKFKKCCARVSLLMKDAAQAAAGAGEGEGVGS